MKNATRYLSGWWKEALNAVIELANLEPGDCLCDANEKIIQAYYNERQIIERSNACLAIINLPGDLDDHVHILAKAIILAATGDRWKVRRYLVVRGLIFDPEFDAKIDCQEEICRYNRYNA